ncbi:MAG: cytochrome c [Notoacmeibacter sp.]|nr:cytochrome c [Notoacmeibacter sp.]
MKKFALALSAVILSATAVTAADDPIAARKALMQAVGASAGTAGAMMKGELAYSPAVGKASIATMAGVSHVFADYFPAGSTSDKSTAAPKIWEDAAGFAAANAKFMADAGAAAAASGKDGPADLDAFKAAAGPVLANCKACHEVYRIQK